MLYKAVKTYDVRLEAVFVNEEARRRAPVWYNAEHDTTFHEHHSGPAMECLRGHHRVVTIADAMDCYEPVDELGRHGPAHHLSADCACMHCDYQ